MSRDVIGTDTGSSAELEARLVRLAAAAFLVACVGTAIWRGAFVSGPQRGLDAQYFYAMGSAWRHGGSPYGREAFAAAWREEIGTPLPPKTEGGVPAVPTLMALVLPLAFVPWPAARLVFDAIDVMALVAVVFFAERLAVRAFGTARRPAVWIGLGLGCLVGGVPAAIYLGQPALLALAGALGALHFAAADRSLPAALGVLAASLKPPIVLLVFVYLLFSGGLRSLLPGIALVVVTSAAALAVSWSPELPADLARVTRAYREKGANRPPHVTGLHSLLADTPLPLPAGLPTGLAAAGVATLGLVEHRRRAARAHPGVGALRVDARRLVTLALVLAATAAFVPLKVYDFAIFVPVFAWLAAKDCRALALALPGLLLVARPNVVRDLVFDAGERALPASYVATIGALAVSLVCAWVLARGPSAPGPSHRAGR